MVKRLFPLVATFAAAFIAPVLFAQPADSDGAYPEAVESALRAVYEQRPSAEDMAAMSRDERRAAMGAWKAAMEAEAARLGLDRSGPKVRPLATPRSVEEREIQIPGTNITYDTGNVFGTAGIASQALGNQFDTARSPANACCFPVETTGSITMITFDMVNTFFGSIVFSLYSDVVGTGAVQVTSMGRPGVTPGLNTLTVSPANTANTYMNGSFIAGVWQFDPTMTAIAVDTGSTGGQGFHAVSLNDNAMNMTGSMFAPVQTTGGMGLNVIFRASGNIATPVELMEFTIE
ncbi:MAG: hypothetical protein AAGM22_13665 [Acidobacteriota bacterium]